MTAGEPAVPGTVAPEDGAADLVAAAVLAVQGVHSLHGGVLGEVGTYLPGRRVAGVRLLPDATEVHVAVVAGTPIPAVARDVHQAVAGARPGAVRIVIEDVVAPGDVDTIGPAGSGGDEETA